MKLRGGGLAAIAAATVVTACVRQELPNAWSVPEHRSFLGVAADDPWCAYVADLRAHLDGGGDRPSDEAREAALRDVRAEAKASKDGDPLWPFRKALICEYTQGAAEELTELDWNTAEQFLETARMAALNPRPADGISPLVPVYDHLDGDAPASLEPVDLTNAAYCQDLATSELALSQQRGGLVEALGFPGSLQRAPDWYAHVQVAYHRWAREDIEGHQFEEADSKFGGIPDHCARFHNALEGSKEFAVKDNLIFLLPELDDPNRAGRLEVRDADGNVVVLDKVLAAAQLNADGTEGERVDFFAEDLAASASLSGAVNRSNNLPPPKVFTLLFDYNTREAPIEDAQLAALRDELQSRSPDEPLRIAMTGHADCVGPRWYNTILSEDRVQNVFDGVIRPTLLAKGFSEDALADDKRFKLAGLGESVPATQRDKGQRCEASDPDRRVVVVVQ